MVIWPPSWAKRAATASRKPPVARVRRPGRRGRCKKAITSAGSVQTMVLGCRCQVTEPNAVRRISSPVDRPNRPSTKSREDQPSAAPRQVRHGARCRARWSPPTGRRRVAARGRMQPRPDGDRGRGKACGSPRRRRTRRPRKAGPARRRRGPRRAPCRQRGHGLGRRCHHALGEVGEGEPQVGEERRDVDPEAAGPAADLEHLAALGPVDLTHEPLEPGHVRPRVLRVQGDAGVEVVGSLYWRSRR